MIKLLLLDLPVANNFTLRVAVAERCGVPWSTAVIVSYRKWSLQQIKSHTVTHILMLNKEAIIVKRIEKQPYFIDLHTG